MTCLSEMMDRRRGRRRRRAGNGARKGDETHAWRSPMLELVVAQRRREEFERAAEMRLIKDAQDRQRLSATQALRQRVGWSLVRTGSRMIANDDHAEAA